MKSGLKIGVLAVQGAFIEHKRMLESLGCECVELRKKSATMTTYISALCLSLLKEMPTADSLEALRPQQGLTIASTLP